MTEKKREQFVYATTPELEEVLSFLHGAGELDGVSFSEVPVGKPRYWWRSKLYAAMLTEVEAIRSAALEEAAKVAKGHKIEGYVPPEDGMARDYYNAAGEDIATAILNLNSSGSASVGGGQG